MSKIKLATVWLDGCSGCHMSLLDIDEGIMKYNGLPFSVEEIVSHLNDSLSKGGD